MPTATTPSVKIVKTRERVQKARNRRLFMDDDDYNQTEEQETLRNEERGRDAIDIFLGGELDDEAERQVHI